jgi:hypothetical protein
MAARTTPPFGADHVGSYPQGDRHPAGGAGRRGGLGLSRAVGRCRRAQVGATLIAAALTGAAGAVPIALASGVGRGANPRVARRIPDVTVLFGRALARVRAHDRPTYARAVMLEADGRTRRVGVGTPTAAGIVSWSFVLDNQPSRSRFASATISYGPPPKGFGTVRGHRAPFLEDSVIRRPPRMTLGAAVAHLRRAGFRGPFFAVTLRSPLGPRVSPPLYIFSLAHRFIAVNTRTGRVSVLH